MDLSCLLNREKAAAMMRRRERRFNRGEPNEPLDAFVRAMIPGAGAVADASIARGLAMIDPRIELLYDKFLPGWIVALRKTGTIRTGPADLFVLIVPVQEELRDRDLNVIWPQGNPCAPGPWLVASIRKHWIGDVGNHLAALREVCGEFQSAAETRERVLDEKTDEWERETIGDVARRIDPNLIPGNKGTEFRRSVDIGIDSPSVAAAKKQEGAAV